MSPEIIYCDNHLLVMHKPAGLLSQADRTGDPDMLAFGKEYIRQKFNKPGNVFLGLVHRLDRPASGVMIFARTSKAASRLTAQFKQHRVDKQYCAIVEGAFSGSGVCEDYLLKTAAGTRVVEESAAGGKFARLSWRAVATNNNLTLVEVRLQTGRPHQIRVQLASRGMPLLGDLRYGAHRKFDGRNLALHAYLLRVAHPTRDCTVTCTAQPGKDWHTLFGDELRDLIPEQKVVINPAD